MVSALRLALPALQKDPPLEIQRSVFIVSGFLHQLSASAVCICTSAPRPVDSFMTPQFPHEGFGAVALAACIGRCDVRDCKRLPLCSSFMVFCGTRAARLKIVSSVI
jgi:hypothetical protein